MAIVDSVLSLAPSIGWAIGLFVVVFLVTAAFGSDGGSLSKEFPWQVRVAALPAATAVACLPERFQFML